MFYYGIFFLIIVLSAVALGYIIGRKLPQLTLIDTESLPSEREAEKKKELMRRRVDRAAQEKARRMWSSIVPYLERLRERFRRLYRKVATLDQQFRRERQLTPELLQEKVDKLVVRAEELAAEGRHQDAEKAYIEAVSLDRKSVAAYRGLGELYLTMKRYKQARETFAFLVKMSLLKHCQATGSVRDVDRIDPGTCDLSEVKAAEIAGNYTRLGRACRSGDDLKAAKVAFRKATQFESANPRHLDLLIETCILEGDRQGASDALERLKEVNPENQKIAGFAEDIASLQEESKRPVRS